MRVFHCFPRHCSTVHIPEKSTSERNILSTTYTSEGCVTSMNKRIAIFTFNGDPMCFIHVLLNSLDMKERGYDVKLIIEGSATGLIQDLHEGRSPQSGLYRKVIESGILACACRACCSKMGTLDSAEAQGMELCGEMSGHPSIARYRDQGYEVITF